MKESLRVFNLVYSRGSKGEQAYFHMLSKADLDAALREANMRGKRWEATGM